LLRSPPRRFSVSATSPRRLRQAPCRVAAATLERLSKRREGLPGGRRSVALGIASQRCRRVAIVSSSACVGSEGATALLLRPPPTVVTLPSLASCRRGSIPLFLVLPTLLARWAYQPISLVSSPSAFVVAALC